MAEGGSIAHRLKEAEKKTEALNQLAMSKGIQVGPRRGYRMNDDEFQHHVVSLAHEKLFKQLGITPDEYRLIIIETWNEEWQKLIAVADAARSEAIRAELTRGIIVKPDIEL